MGDPRDDALVDEVVRRLAAEFGPKHERIHQDFAETQERITALYEQFAEMQRRMDDLERKAGFKVLLDQAREAANGNMPPTLPLNPETSRPPAIDRACSGDPADGPVMVLIPEFGLEIEPEPGSDPEAVWQTALHAISAESRGKRGYRR